MKIELKCINCEKTFITDYKFRNKKFCNNICYFEYARKNKLLGKKKDKHIRETRICVECGKEFIEKIKHKRMLCSNECRNKWNLRKENKTKRINNSRKSTFEKYGYYSVFEKKNFNEELKKILLKKYGVSHPMYNIEFVEKLKKTIQIKYIPTLLKKIKESNLELLDEYTQNKNGNTSKPYKFLCLKCNNIFTSTLLGSGKIPICRKCFPLFKNSLIEEKIHDLINEYNINHLDNNRKLLNGCEIDIFLPEHNIGFEINGNYYHSEIYGGKNKNYHINKTNLGYKKNIKLIHIFEDEIKLKEDIVKSRLKEILKLNKNKIYARKCIIKEISKNDSSIFLNNNHLQGNSIDIIRIGLFFNNELVALMTFGKKRKSLGNKSLLNEYELIRFCNKINISVIGGFSKLLKYFINQYKPKKIITYADIRWSGINPEDTVYNKCGFKYCGNTPPNYWYVKVDSFIHRFHRFTFRKDVLVKEGFDKNKTEWKIMQERGFDRIWDCGSMKFELDFTQ